MMVQRTGNQNGKQITIGVFMGDINVYSDQIWQGVNDCAADLHINTISFVGRNLAPGIENRANNIIYQLAHQSSLDGLIVLTAGLGSLVSHAQIADFCRQYSPLPLVSIGETIEGMPGLMIDNQTGFRDLLRHLIQEHEYRKIAFMQGPENNFDVRERFRVYREVLVAENIPFDADLVVQGGFIPPVGKRVF